MSIGIVIDSTSDIRRSYAEQNGIKVVPLKVAFHGEEHIEDETFDLEAYYKHFETEDFFLPKSYSPTTETFYKTYRDFLDEGITEIVVITVSSAVSTTYKNALLAANMLKSETRGLSIEVIDSLNASLGIVFLTEAAVQLRERGSTFKEIIRQVRERVPKITNFTFLPSLKYLKAAGRINTAKYMVTNILRKKPIVTMNEVGENEVVGSETSIEKGIFELLRLTTKDFTVYPLRMALVHSNAPEMVDLLEEYVIEKLENVSLRNALTGVSISANTGPNALALICEFEEDQK